MMMIINVFREVSFFAFAFFFRLLNKIEKISVLVDIFAKHTVSQNLTRCIHNYNSSSFILSAEKEPRQLVILHF